MDLPVKFPSETEVILEDVASFRALSPAERIRDDSGHAGRRRASDEHLAEGRMGQAVFGRAKTPRATEHPGVHRTPCTLTPISYRAILCTGRRIAGRGV